MSHENERDGKKEYCFHCFQHIYINHMSSLPFDFFIDRHPRPARREIPCLVIPFLHPHPRLNLHAHPGAMCIQTIGICPYSHREHMGLHWCSLLISRGLWNIFDCSAFEEIEIESPHWSCQTCLEQTAGRKTYLNASIRSQIWRSFFRKMRHRKNRARRLTMWEMEMV